MGDPRVACVIWSGGAVEVLARGGGGGLGCEYGVGGGVSGAFWGLFSERRGES